MAHHPVGTIAVALVTILVSWWAFQRPDIRQRLLFHTRAILARKEYERLIASGFIHADWGHLLFNMISFYFFASSIELRYGLATALFIYFSGIIGGGLLSLLLHRHHDYTALGASGGVCGIIFAAIFLVPGSSIVVFPLPIGIPAWLYAIVFLIGSYYQMRRDQDNIGHDAHLGGALIGLATATVLYPKILSDNLPLYLAVVIITLFLMVHLWRYPLYGHPWRPRNRPEETHPRYTTSHREEAERVDALLERAAQEGLQSLSKDERRILQKYSDRLRRREGRD